MSFSHLEWGRSRRDHPAGRGPSDLPDGGSSPIPARSPWFDESDWTALRHLLESPEPAPPPPAAAELTEALDRFAEQFPDRYVSAAAVVNPLLDLWAVARRVGPAVAAPFEALLPALLVRGRVTQDELAAVANAALAAARSVGPGPVTTQAL